jgi:hypothetical protein
LRTLILDPLTGAPAKPESMTACVHTLSLPAASTGRRVYCGRLDAATLPRGTLARRRMPAARSNATGSIPPRS